MIAATMDSHHTWSKSGIWENITSVIPNIIMYTLLDIWHGFFPPLSWKQLDLFTALQDESITEREREREREREHVKFKYVHYLLLTSVDKDFLVPSLWGAVEACNQQG